MTVHPVLEFVGCPRCQGTGWWPPTKFGLIHHRQGNCSWCAGYGNLTRAELAERLREQKQRRLDVLRMTPDERRAATKWDV